MRHSRTSPMHNKRIAQRHMRISLRCANHDHQNPPSRLLLANYGGRLPHLYQKVYTMPEAWQPHPLETRTTPLHTLPMAFCKVGNRHSWPLHPGKRQVKFLIVPIDYFTKWIEAKPLATITARQVQQFVWKDIICRYDVLHTIITDNGRQFIDKELAKFYTGLDIKHVTSSVEHPQSTTNESPFSLVYGLEAMIPV